MSHVATGGVLASQPSNCGRLANTNCPQQNQGRHSVVTPPLALRLPVLWASTPRPPTTLPCGLRPPRLRRVIQKGQFSRLLCGGYQPREGLSVNAILYLFIYSSFSFVSATPWALPVRQAGGGVPRFPVLSTSAPSLGCAWMDTCATHAATAVDDTQASKAKERQAAVTCCFGERERQRERRGWCSMPWVLSQCASETHFQQARRPPTEKVPTEPGLGLSAWKHVLAGWKAN